MQLCNGCFRGVMICVYLRLDIRQSVSSGKPLAGPRKKRNKMQKDLRYNDIDIRTAMMLLLPSVKTRRPTTDGRRRRTTTDDD